MRLRLFTLLGWSPALRVVLKGRVLACGCLVGEYAGWRKHVTVVDYKADGCPHAAHRPNGVLEER